MTFREEIDQGLTAAMNRYATAHALPQLRWHLCTSAEVASIGRAQVIGQASAGDYPEEDVPAAVQAWAATLQIQVAEQPGHVGTLEARGGVDGIDIEVWGVTDHEAFARGPATEQG